MNDGAALLDVESVCAGYGAIQVLYDVSLNVPRDSCVALLGSNGAGKTTLLNAVSGLLRIRGGRVIFDGVDITNANPVQIVRRGISQAPGGRRIFTKQTVRANLALGLYGTSLDRDGQRERVDYVLHLFPALQPRLDHPAGHLSGGQQQMLAIAQALIRNPTLLVLDEPSMGLAPNIVGMVFDTLSQIRAERTTVLLVEQESRHAMQLADYVYILKTGRLVAQGIPAELSDEDIQTAYLGA